MPLFSRGFFMSNNQNKPKECVQFKHDIDKSRLFYMHPLIIMVMLDMANWHMERGIPFIVTSTMSTIHEDLELKRVSSTHRTGRAFDFRVKDLSSEQLSELVNTFNHKYKTIAATTHELEQKLILIHGKNANRHAHVQINSLYIMSGI